MTLKLTEDSFERMILYQEETSHTIDLRHITFIDPYGMVGLLEIGELLKSKGIKKTIHLPKPNEVIKYLERMDFFKYARRYFEIEPTEFDASDMYFGSTSSDVLLEITPIEKPGDIHFIVGKLKESANRILTKHLHYNENTVVGFIVALSEVCQNIIEHSEKTGFVGIQKYHFNNINKNVVEIAVMDLGIGFKESLKARFNINNDIEAIEKALLQGASRHDDAGRGHGLAAVRRFVNKWNGKLSIRSGTARASIIPKWSRGTVRDHGLIHFPGSQINILLPEI